ncbi:MAG: hypothetical protein OCD01_11270 [Fibrobacterales bacterium]
MQNYTDHNLASFLIDPDVSEEKKCEVQQEFDKRGYTKEDIELLYKEKEEYKKEKFKEDAIGISRITKILCFFPFTSIFILPSYISNLKNASNVERQKAYYSVCGFIMLVSYFILMVLANSILGINMGGDLLVIIYLIGFYVLVEKQEERFIPIKSLSFEGISKV